MLCSGEAHGGTEARLSASDGVTSQIFVCGDVCRELFSLLVMPA
jgi:hypothetical protein